jgi:hypothetical protein
LSLHNFTFDLRLFTERNNIIKSQHGCWSVKKVQVDWIDEKAFIFTTALKRAGRNNELRRSIMSLNINVSNSSVQTTALSAQAAQTQRHCRPDSNAAAMDETVNTGGPRQVGLLGAIANALQDLGANMLSNAESTQDTSATDVTDTSASDSSGNNAAQALGEFLQNLIAALQKEGGAARPQANRPPPPPPIDGGNGGGIAKDLQKLIAQLSGQSSTENSSNTAAADGSTTSVTNTGDTSSTTDTTTALSNSFSELLNALGVNADNSQQTLQNFLQNILTQVSENGRQGNFINTSA